MDAMTIPPKNFSEHSRQELPKDGSEQPTPIFTEFTRAVNDFEKQQQDLYDTARSLFAEPNKLPSIVKLFEDTDELIVTFADCAFYINKNTDGNSDVSIGPIVSLLEEETNKRTEIFGQLVPSLRQSEPRFDADVAVKDLQNIYSEPYPLDTDKKDVDILYERIQTWYGARLRTSIGKLMEQLI